jgi:hypothetical protein
LEVYDWWFKGKIKVRKKASARLSFGGMFVVGHSLFYHYQSIIENDRQKRLSTSRKYFGLLFNTRPSLP